MRSRQLRDPLADQLRDPFVGSPPEGRVLGPPRRPRGRLPGELGIWVLILGDMLIFAQFFGVFMYERTQYADAFEQGRRALELPFGALNTLLLLTGSLCVVFGVRALRRGADRPARAGFGLAMLCGAGFVADKVHEYSSLTGGGHTPASNDFFMYFFVFTGIHLLHLVLGLVALTIMWRISRKPGLDSRDIANVESGASFWHLVDLLWLVLFALLFLVR